MNINDILKKSFQTTWEQQADISVNTMITSFAVVCLLSIYIFMVYKHNTKRGFYSVNFVKTLIGLPIITTGIVYAMQVNLLVSLGMVGALSIVRFRNAVKDPLDLLFLFWSISIGIICGTGTYSIAIFVSIVLTLALYLADLLPTSSNSYMLVLNCSIETQEEQIIDILKPLCQYHKVRTRNRKIETLDILIEVKTKKDQVIVDEMMKLEGVTKATLLTHDGEIRV